MTLQAGRRLRLKFESLIEDQNEVRWAVASTLELPLDLHSDLGGGGLATIDAALLTHDQRDTPPTIGEPSVMTRSTTSGRSRATSLAR